MMTVVLVSGKFWNNFDQEETDDRIFTIARKKEDIQWVLPTNRSNA
jgi:hypothetical protein